MANTAFELKLKSDWIAGDRFITLKVKDKKVLEDGSVIVNVEPVNWADTENSYNGI